MARRKSNLETPMDMTPMIDCVFQLMIFFIVTFKLDADLINEKIELAQSPHGPAIEEKVPGTMIIEVDKRGTVTIARVILNDSQLFSLVKQAVNRIGQNNVQVLIRADMQSKHSAVRRVMDQCTRAGVWRMRFAALKKKGT
jgi:biopolymer transport protein ExbD